MIAIMVEAALRGLVLAAAAGLGLCIFRVKNIPAQKAIWSIVLLSALAAPFVMRWKLPTRITWALPLPAHLHFAAPAIHAGASPRMTMARQTSGRATSRIADTGFSDSSASGIPYIVPSPHGVAFYSAKTSAANPQFPLVHPALIAAIAYFCVCCALFLRLLWGLFAAWRLWSASEPISPIVVPYARIRASQSISSPVNVGSGVVLPSNFTTWPPERLRVVLAHERSHVRQLDFYLQLMARIYTALFWFSPLGWWLSRHLSALGEAISDRAGLSAASSRSAYAEVVLEFASKPRRILHQSSLGVAMACSGNVSNRIDRLLSESRLRIEFTEGRRRAWLAFLLVLAAALGTTSLIRIPAAHAAQSAPLPPPTPEQPAAPASAEPHDQALPPPSDTSQTSSPETAPTPPTAPATQDAASPSEPPTPGSGTPQANATEHSYGYGLSTNGDSYAFVNGADSDITFSGNWNSDVKAEIVKARRIAHGKFLWFMHNGKSYVVDDPSVVTRLEAMYKPMEELGRQQEELGKQQEVLGKEQERLGDLQEQVSTPTPDLSKELADVQAALAKLQAAQDKTLTSEQLADIQKKIGELQGRLGELQGNVGTRAGSYGAEQGRLGEKQGKLGEEQGRLGAQQGKLAMENESKVRSIIDESLHNGTARPVD